MRTDHTVAGKRGRVTGRIAPGTIGEVSIEVRGGAECFFAYAADGEEVIERGREVVVMDYQPPRTVTVTAL